MKLYRYSLAYFHPRPKQTWARKATRSGDVVVNLGKELEDDGKPGELGIFVTASTRLSASIDLDHKGRVLVPEAERTRCEETTMHVVNLISVLESCSRIYGIELWQSRTWLAIFADPIGVYLVIDFKRDRIYSHVDFKVWGSY